MRIVSAQQLAWPFAAYEAPAYGLNCPRTRLGLGQRDPLCTRAGINSHVEQLKFRRTLPLADLGYPHRYLNICSWDRNRHDTTATGPPRQGLTGNVALTVKGYCARAVTARLRPAVPGWACNSGPTTPT